MREYMYMATIEATRLLASVPAACTTRLVGRPRVGARFIAVLRNALASAQHALVNP